MIPIPFRRKRATTPDADALHVANNPTATQRVTERTERLDKLHATARELDKAGYERQRPGTRVAGNGRRRAARASG